MSLTSSDDRLLRVSKASKEALSYYKEGVYLETSAGRKIDDLLAQASADRLTLSEEFLASADRLMRARPPMRRVAIGRYYYAMYHAMRAVVYFRMQGDDYEQHSKLPSMMPQDFPRKEFWKNELKDARLRRNETDYDPYPMSDAAFRDTAISLGKSARDLVDEARSYLQSKGCGYV